MITLKETDLSGSKSAVYARSRFEQAKIFSGSSSPSRVGTYFCSMGTPKFRCISKVVANHWPFTSTLRILFSWAFGLLAWDLAVQTRTIYSTDLIHRGNVRPDICAVALLGPSQIRHWKRSFSYRTIINLSLQYIC